MSQPSEDEKWVPKAEAAKILGVSIRQIEHRAQKGEIRKRKLPKQAWEKIGRVLYADADLQAILSGDASEQAAALRTPPPARVPQAPPVLALPAALIDALRERREPAPRPWLTLKEAEAWSGLPAAFLLAQARRGAPYAVNVGQGSREFWRFNRDGLNAIGV